MAYFGEVIVLCEKTVAGVYRFDIGYFGGTYYCRDIEVACCCVWRAYADGFGCLLDVWCVFVGL